jgi:hypothetical protein
MIGRKAEWVQRSREGLAFDRSLEALYQMLRNPTPEQRADLEAISNEYRQLTLTPGSVSSTPVLQNLAVMYRNDMFIGLRVMPSVTTSQLGLDEGALAGTYWAKTKRDSFDEGPDDEIGTRGDVQEVSESFSRTDVTLVRRALKRFVDAWAQSQADAPVLRMINPTIMVADRLALKQERRIATVVQTATSYGSNYTTLTGSDQWNSSAGGNPKAVVDAAKDACFTGGPGRWVGTCSVNVYNTLKLHPTVLDTLKYTNSRGFATPQMLADYLELDELLVGVNRYASANEGQTTQTYARVWADKFSVNWVGNPPANDMPAWGITLETSHFQQQWFENGRGGRGGFYNQIAFGDLSVVIASDAGYLVQGVLAT